jgi:hypothetical protein
MRDHLKEIHQWQSGSKGGRPKQSTSSAARELWTKVTMAPICCQTFHRSNFFSFFPGHASGGSVQIAVNNCLISCATADDGS